MKTANQIYCASVLPINSLAEATKQGNYTEIMDGIEADIKKLREPSNLKKIYVVKFDSGYSTDTIDSNLFNLGMKPCVDSPNYLFGLIASLPKKQLPKELDNLTLIAPNSKTSPCIYLCDGVHPSCAGVIFHSKPYERILQLMFTGLGFTKNVAVLAEET